MAVSIINCVSVLMAVFCKYVIAVLYYQNILDNGLSLVSQSDLEEAYCSLVSSHLIQ